MQYVSDLTTRCDGFIDVYWGLPCTRIAAFLPIGPRDCHPHITAFYVSGPCIDCGMGGERVAECVMVVSS